jgi:type VI secretion system secreted protein VgrG
MLTTQDNVYLSITTTLGKDQIFLREFKGVERISGLFDFDLYLYVPYQVNKKGPNLDLSTLVETEATVTVCINKKKRYFHGVITEVTQGGTFLHAGAEADRTAQSTYFQAKLRPKMWGMTLTEQCRIFQKKTPLEIIKSVLSDHSITLQDNTSKAGTVQKDFCVQYNESNFNFVSRLMEEEGIAYYFKHKEGSHTLTLVDESQPYQALEDADFATLKMSPYPERPLGGDFSLWNLRFLQQIVPSKHTYTDYDFEKTQTSLKVDSAGKGSGREVYHYPGRYTLQDRGTALSDIRMAALEFPKNSLQAQSDIHMVEVGSTFTLSDEVAKDLVRDDLKSKDFTIFSIEHRAVLEALETNQSFSPENVFDLEYNNQITFYKKETPYHPPKTAHIPKIYGTQTATVSGKAGEEIWTDKYGRIMVKFHWDLSDTKDDAVSCWVRVAQSWADKNWGAFFIPRVGQEVIITFLNGDPDQPLVIGCVYNATNMPPYGPDMAIKSGFKTNSSKGGGGFNELHFDDTKGSENFFMQAQTDMTTMILDGQRTTTIKGTKSKGHDILTIVEGKRDTTLSKGDDLLTLTQGKRDTTLTKGDDFLTLAAGSRTTKISDDLNLTIGKSATIKVGKDGTVTVDGSLTLNITKDLIINADNIKTLGKTLTDFKGPTIKIEADSLVDIKGATAKLTGAGGVTIAGGMIALTGGMIKLG